MSALIGALRVSLSAETAQFEAGMKRAQRTANQTRGTFQKAFGGLGGIVKAGFAGVISGLSIGLIIQGSKAALEYAGSLGEVSQQLGVTTRDLQVFRYAAGQTGVSQAELEQGLSKLTVTLGKVAAGAKAPIAALNAIGVSAEQLRGKDTGEAFRIIADGLEKVTDRSQRAIIEMTLFGRSGAQLDNLLAGGSAAINGLAQAAEELGIVLSAEQIAKADETADKLDAVKTVLSAQIAGVVADNAQAIVGLADSLAYLISQAAQAAAKMQAFYRSLAIGSARFVRDNPLLAKVAFGTKGSAAILRAGAGAIRGNIADNAPAPAAAPKATGGADIGNFLAGGGGGSKKGRSGSDDAERKRLQALQDAFRFDQDLLRAQMDTLRAQQSLSTDYSERSALSIQMLNLEQQSFQREMEYAVAAGELTKAQAAQLEAEYAKRDAFERQAVLADEQTQRVEDYNNLEILNLELKRDELQSQEALANNSSEMRDVRLRLLDLDYRIERAKLEQVLADEKASWAAKEAARIRLQSLNKTYANDKQGVMRDTAGPFERAQMDFSDLSDEMENLRVNGIMAAGDALATLATEGFGSFKEQAISAIKAVIAEFIRLQTIKFLFSMMGSAGGAGAGMAGGLGGAGGMSSLYGGVDPMFLTGMAGGGSFTVNGFGGLDKNVLSINGLPVARVDNGERIDVNPVRMGRGGGGGSSPTINFAISGPVTRETQMQIAAATKRAISSSNRKGF